MWQKLFAGNNTFDGGIAEEPCKWKARQLPSQLLLHRSSVILHGIGLERLAFKITISASKVHSGVGKWLRIIQASMEESWNILMQCTLIHCSKQVRLRILSISGWYCGLFLTQLVIVCVLGELWTKFLLIKKKRDNLFFFRISKTHQYGWMALGFKVALLLLLLQADPKAWKKLGMLYQR